MQFPQCPSLVGRMEHDWQSPVFYGFWFDAPHMGLLQKLIGALKTEYIATIDEPTSPEVDPLFVTENREFFLAASCLVTPQLCAVAARFGYPSQDIYESRLLSQMQLDEAHVEVDRLLQNENWGYAIIYATNPFRTVDALDRLSAWLSQITSLETSWKLAAAKKR